ncbi:MAG: enoyl-CoA hydratase/isomerase family protein [Deltaproteobacteria bacterium]|nr:enoyl-CoA hydratase/isomerase family protein [Deltaproteobacteria bacterium]
MVLVIAEVQKRVLYLTLNRPEVRNALNHELISQLLRELKKYEKNKNISVIVLKSTGDVFCSGGDIQWLKELGQGSAKKNLVASHHLESLFYTLNIYPKPVLGIVQGAAMGGGFGLLSVCDYVIAHRETTFSLSELRLGIVPSVILPYVLAKIGESQTRALMLTGHKWKAEQAKASGLVHDTYENSDQLEVTMKVLVQDLCKSGPLAVAQAKTLIQDVKNLHGRELRHRVSRTLAEVRATPEAQAGLKAFLNKKLPPWM